MGGDFIRGLKAWTPLGESEQAMLLASVQHDQSPLPAFSPHFDWHTFTSRVITDGLSVLVYQRLKGVANVPAESLARLKQDYYRNVTANHMRLNELRRLGKLLEEKNIPLLVLKGGALALSVYKDPAERYMGDLDVAVPSHQAQAAYQLFQNEGYTLHDADKLPEDKEAMLQQQGWHIRLTKQFGSQQMELECHWPLRQKVLVNQVATLDVKQIWESAVSLEAENNLFQPSLVMMLLHLCIHAGIQHRFNELGLRHYVDLDRILRHYKPSADFWRTFIVAAKEANASQAVYFCLQLTQQLFGTPIPPEMLAQLQPSAWKRQLFTRSFAPADAINRTRALHDSRRYLWRLLTTDHLTTFLNSAHQVLFPGRRFLADYYGNPNPTWLWVYGLWYPFHALWRAGKRRWRLLISFGKRLLVPARWNV